MKRFATSLLVLPLLVPTLIACTSDDTPAPAENVEPSVSAVLPSRAFLARKLDVTISGSGTHWDEKTAVDFGEGITIEDLIVASPTALLARIDVAKDAAVGPRDVTVNAGGVASLYKGAFTLDAPMALTVKGTAAQGSVFFVSAQDKDLSTPFDTTAQASGLFSVDYTGIALAEQDGVTATPSNVTAFSAEFTVLTDVNVTPDTKSFSIESGTAGSDKVSFPYPAGLPIAARQPVALVPGTPAHETIANPFESQLYVITPGSGLNLVDVEVTTGAARFVLLPKSGKVQDAVTGFGATTTLLASNADPYYAIALDTSGDTGAFTIASALTPVTPTEEAAGNNDSKAQAQAVTAPALVDSALSDLTDVDWFAFTAAAGDVGKTLNVLTLAGDAQTDTLVTVYRADGTTVFATSDDGDFHERLDTEPLPASETYYVKVSFSTQAKTYAASKSKYRLVVRVR